MHFGLELEFIPCLLFFDLFFLLIQSLFVQKEIKKSLKSLLPQTIYSFI